MRVTLLTAVIVGILLLPVYAQTPQPMQGDTTMKMGEKEMAKEMDKSAEMAKEMKPAEEMEEPASEEMMEEVEEAAMNTDLTLEDMAFCSGVEDREPVSRDSSFSSDIGKIFCWSNVMNGSEGAFVEHVWYHNGEEMARVTLPATYSRNRVWSSKTILPDWTGKWTVMVMAGSKKLGEMSCTIE